MKTLECSSRGDKRFSAFYARVKVYGKVDSIENHYQLAKRFGNGPAPKTWRDGKGKKPTHFELNGKKFPLEKGLDFYNWLWAGYLNNNPELVVYLNKFDAYNDMFAKPGNVNQADAIKTYMDSLPF